MNKKYKISKYNLNEFWNLFGNRKTPEKLQKIIDNDPVLKKLQGKVNKIDVQAKTYLDKIQKEDPEIYNYLLKHGFVK